MELEIKRDYYPEQLIKRKHNGLIKIITDIRRCGKSFLLRTLFKKYLLENGVDESHIIEMSFDLFDNIEYRDAEIFYPWAKEQDKDEEKYYFLLDEVPMFTLSFSEFMTIYDGNRYDGWNEYITYGGIPIVVLTETEEQKVAMLDNLFHETYIRDVVQRNKIRNVGEMEALLDALSSAIGALTNPNKQKYI